MSWLKRKSVVNKETKWWEKYLIPLVCGIVMSISQPTLLPGMSSPLSPGWLFFPLAFVGLIPLGLTVWNRPLRFAFGQGFRAGLVYFTIAIYWVVNAMYIYGKLNFFVSVLGLLLLAAWCAFFWGGAMLTAEFIRSQSRIPPYFAFPISWTAWEYFRNYLFTGFPWSQLGYTQISNFYFIQISDLFGVYGVTFALTLVAGALIYLAAYFKALHHNKPNGAVSLALFTLALVYGYGFLRAHDIELSENKAEKIKVSLLQGNIDQRKKMNARKYRYEILEKYKSLALKADAEKPLLIVWPEASYPWLLERDTKSFRETKLGEDTTFNAYQLIGIPLVFTNSSGGRNLLNSSMLLDPNLTVLTHYDKSHLVPFGEYVPLGKWIPIEKLVPMVGTFIPGEEVKPISVQNVPFGILICYEGIFPEISRVLAQKGAEVLFNLTNDAWYGTSSAPYQHLSMYAFRAIETRRALGRATNTGVSAFISPTGKILDTTPLFEDVMITSEMPRMTIKTIYVLIGDILPQICWLLIFLISLVKLPAKLRGAK